MQAFVSSVSSVGVMAMLGAMFVIVFMCVRKAVKEMSFFGDAAGLAVSFCVALLSIIGLVRFFGSTEAGAPSGREPTETGGLLDVVLLPYVALAATILLVLLLLAAGRVLHGGELRHLLGGRTNQRTIAKPGMQERDSHQRELKPFEPSGRKQIIMQKNRKAINKLERER